MTGRNNNFDRGILTGQEHTLIGSTPWVEEAKTQHFVPLKVLQNGRTPEVIAEVARLRNELGELGSITAGLYYGLEDFETPIFKLPDLDPLTGEVVVREPKLAGMEMFNGEVIRDPEELGKYKFTAEAKRALFINEVSVGSPEEGF